MEGGVGRSGGVFGKQNCSENEPALFILNVVFQLVWEKTQLFRSECSLFSSSLYKKKCIEVVVAPEMSFELMFECHFALWDG